MPFPILSWAIDAFILELGIINHSIVETIYVRRYYKSEFLQNFVFVFVSFVQFLMWHLGSKFQPWVNIVE